MARITVEDCLTKENNRFALVQLASKRTKQLLQGSRPLIEEHRNNKAVVLALREIAGGKVRFMTEEEARIAKEQAEIEATRAAEEALSAPPPEPKNGATEITEDSIFAKPPADEPIVDDEDEDEAVEDESVEDEDLGDEGDEEAEDEGSEDSDDDEKEGGNEPPGQDGTGGEPAA